MSREWGTLQPGGNVCAWDDESRARRAHLMSKSFPDGEHPVVSREIGEWERTETPTDDRTTSGPVVSVVADAAEVARLTAENERLRSANVVWRNQATSAAGVADRAIERQATARAERDAQRRRAEAAERRCWAVGHPTVTPESLIPCMLDRGHEGDHWSSSGCSGGAVTWRDALSAVIDKAAKDVRALAELYLYDGDTDQPVNDGYGALICFAAALAAGLAAPIVETSDEPELPEGHPLPWDELRPYEQQQGGYWLYPPGCDVYGNGKFFVRVSRPALPVDEQQR